MGTADGLEAARRSHARRAWEDAYRAFSSADDTHALGGDDLGRLADAAKQPFEGWLDVMAWIEADEEKMDQPDEGWLWIHRAD